jgi:RNA polymerase sigma-70 factor, ECF subfamily
MLGSTGAEADLVRRILAGEEAAFEEFFSAMFPALYRFALVRLDHQADAAEDVAQATLCRAMTKLHTFRGEASLLTWLCTFCRHEISAYVRARRWAARVDLIEDEPEVRAALESLHSLESGSPDARLDRESLAALVQRILDHLPPHYGDVLEWKYIDDLSVNDIAVRIGVKPKAAESLLTRARRAFRDAFQSVMRNLSFQPLQTRQVSEE